MDDYKLACLSAGLISLHALRREGLCEGGPWINVEKAEATLERLRGEGIEPRTEDVQAAAIGFVNQWNAEHP